MIRIHARFHVTPKSKSVLGNVNRISFQLDEGVYILEVSDKDGRVVSCQTGWTVPDKHAIVYDAETESLDNCEGEDFIKVLSECWNRDFNVFEFPMITPRSAGVLTMIFTKADEIAKRYKTVIFKMKNDYRMFNKGKYYTGFHTNNEGLVMLHMSNGTGVYVPETEVEG